MENHHHHESFTGNDLLIYAMSAVSMTLMYFNPENISTILDGMVKVFTVVIPALTSVKLGMDLVDRFRTGKKKKRAKKVE